MLYNGKLRSMKSFDEDINTITIQDLEDSSVLKISNNNNIEDPIIVRWPCYVPMINRIKFYHDTSYCLPHLEMFTKFTFYVSNVSNNRHVKLELSKDLINNSVIAFSQNIVEEEDKFYYIIPRKNICKIVAQVIHHPSTPKILYLIDKYD